MKTMGTFKKTFQAFVVTLCMIPSVLFAQVETPNESPFSIGADLYSNYVWRGSKFGTGIAVQPSVKFSSNNFTIGAWGSFDASGYTEADLYLSYSFGFGLTLGVTDYYYPTWLGAPTDYFNYSDTAGNHAIELNASYALKNFSLSANYILNEAPGAGSLGGDMYFEAGYSFSHFKVFAGAGNGWHTLDNEFAFCNIGIATTKTIVITEKFSIPVTGTVLLNPDKKQLFLVVGFSF